MYLWTSPSGVYYWQRAGSDGTGPFFAYIDRQLINHLPSKMIIKSHLCGVAVAYEPLPHRMGTRVPTGRPQGSRYNQQKRKIADAVEWMRLYSGKKALIFVATSPGFTNAADEGKLISKLVHNLTNGYGIEHYVWVRELTKKGFPHFHFVVAADYLPAKQIAVYWSSLFGTTATNSVRFGTKPVPGKRRVYHVLNSKMCWYLCKYLGKSIGESDPRIKRKIRSFHVSNRLAVLSAPVVYGEEIYESKFTHLHSRQFVITNDHEDYYDQGRAPPVFNPKSKQWLWTGHGQTYIGTPKGWKRKNTKE